MDRVRWVVRIDSVHDCPLRMYTAVSCRIAAKSGFSWSLELVGFHGAFVSMYRKSRQWLLHNRVYGRINPDGRGIKGLQKQLMGS